MPKQKWPGQIQIGLVKYPSSKVSDPSEVPRFVGKLVFDLVKEVKLVCVSSILIHIVLARASDNLVIGRFF